MRTNFFLTTLLLIVLTRQTFAQTTETLRQKIQHIISGKSLEVGVAIMSNNGIDTLSVNGDKHFPMQSVFKFHIGLAILSEIDNGRFSLDQKVKIEPDELLPNLYSSLR